MDRLRPHERSRAGLARTWQAGELFGTLTVEQNLMVTADPPSWGTLWKDLFGRRERSAHVAHVLDLVGLGGMSHAMAGSLTLGQQKLVGVARALASDPEILLLDEPAAGLDSTESREFAGRVADLVSDRRGALLIDHDIDLMLGVCDVIYVLELGRLIFCGKPDEVRKDPTVIAAYLGSPVEE